LNAHHLIWVHIEGGGGGCALPVVGRPSPLASVPYPCVRLTGMVCGWVSTIGSVSGLMTGVSPAFLLKNHISKGQAADGSRFSLPHDPLPVFLEKQGYQVEGFSTFFSFREQIPFFYERHTAVRGTSLCFVPAPYAAEHGCTPAGKHTDGRPLYHYGDVAGCTNITAPDSTTVERVREALAAMDTHAPRALFIHLGERHALPDLFDTLWNAGFSKDNSVILVMGDHGFPDERFGVAGRTAYGNKMPHDKGMTEQDLRVAGFLGFPGCKNTNFDRLCISWDMAPTVLALLGHDPAAVMPRATGMNLTPHFADAAAYPARTVRMDNRYVEQEDLKVVALLDEHYRYVFRFRPHWSGGPYYSYYLDARPCPEELYRRDDLDEAENLVFSPDRLPVLHEFRRRFRETEEAIIAHHFGSRVFAYPALERARFHIPEPFRNTDLGMVPASQDRVVKGLLAALRLELEQLGVRRPLLVGPEADTSALLAHGVLQAGSFAAVTADGPETVTAEYDAVVLGSLPRELELFARWRTAVGDALPILSPYRRLERRFDPAWPLAIPDGDQLDYFRSHAGVIYGAGGRCRDFLARTGHADMGMTLRAVLDSSPALHGATEGGLPVYTYSRLSKDDLLALEFDYFLIASFAHFSILKDIRHWTLRGKRIYYLAEDLRIQPDHLPREGSWLPQQQA